MQLHELNNGDKFYHKSMEMKTTPIYVVVDNKPVSGKIKCKNLLTEASIRKMAKLDVIKTR